MNKPIALMLTMLVSAACAAAPTAALNNDPATYRTLTDQAKADYKVAMDKCDAYSGNAKSTCKDEAKLARAKSEADAVAKYKDSVKDRSKANISVADAEYTLAKDKCKDLSGHDKDSCLGNAKADHTRAVADAKADRQANDTSLATKAADASSAAGDAVADSTITTKVKADIFKEPELKSMSIHVETDKGVVKLSGFVAKAADADRAVEVARNVKGVTKVESTLAVK
ncbi:MAG: BON domain-containing protein [Pseudomonadota bacterium]